MATVVSPSGLTNPCNCWSFRTPDYVMEAPKCVSLTIKIGWINNLFNKVLINSYNLDDKFFKITAGLRNEWMFSLLNQRYLAPDYICGGWQHPKISMSYLRILWTSLHQRILLVQLLSAWVQSPCKYFGLCAAMQQCQRHTDLPQLSFPLHSHSIHFLNSKEIHYIFINYWQKRYLKENFLLRIKPGNFMSSILRGEKITTHTQQYINIISSLH